MINGPLAARLWLESTGPESVVVVRVLDVAPDGTARELTNGLQAASFRAVDQSRSRIVDGWNLQPYHPFTADSVQPMTPGEPVPVDVEIFSTAAVVPAGHRLQVSAGAADFPHAVSPLPRLADSTLVATQVHHGPDTPSHLVLPVVGASGPAPEGPGNGHDGAPRSDGGVADDGADEAPGASPDGALAGGAPLPATGAGATPILGGLLALAAVSGSVGRASGRSPRTRSRRRRPAG